MDTNNIDVAAVNNALTVLQSGEVTLKGIFQVGSNHAFLVEVKLQRECLEAVYKPTKGEKPLWDFPSGTLAKREVAAYLISE
ncbi:MAG: phosphatidylinositol kinase, partial [Chloroflexota bacterium]|nr:phosphatidylinositol kinase [Chloroflexota bacterium]